MQQVVGSESTSYSYDVEVHRVTISALHLIFIFFLWLLNLMTYCDKKKINQRKLSVTVVQF